MTGRLVLLAAALVLAGCAFNTGPLTVPAPFQPRIKPLSSVAVMSERDIIVVPPALPAPAAKAFLWGLTRDAGDADILILTKPPQRPAHVLEGIARPDGTIDWYLRHAAGGLIAHFASALPADPDGAMAAGRETARGLIAALGHTPGSAAQGSTVPAAGDPLYNPPDAPPPKAGPAPKQLPKLASAAPVLTVGEIAGAPGDGNTALAAALTEILRHSPYPLAGSSEAADVTITATVGVESVDAATQGLTIAWRLSAQDGTEIATLTQANAIPAGLTDGRWGDMAYDIALGAAQGLTDALTAVANP